ncbi:MAG: hypothetical protein KAJ93_02320 [Methanosarcinales archaeon]|nr:hypothetical protein [Methanosarcinales archaeon]
MEIKYNGPSPLLYRGAPSGTEYMLMPGEKVKVSKADNKFFKNMSKAPNSSFKICGAVNKAVESVKGVANGVIEPDEDKQNGKGKANGGNK